MSVPSTELADPVDLTVDILSTFASWPGRTPDVYRIEEIPEKSRENNSQLALYVFSPEDTTPTDFDAEYSDVEEEATVEILIYSFDSDETAQTAERIRQLFEEYARDNRTNTPYHSIKPTSAGDNKSSKVSRRTDHYIDSITLTFERLRSPGLP